MSILLVYAELSNVNINMCPGSKINDVSLVLKHYAHSESKPKLALSFIVSQFYFPVNIRKFCLVQRLFFC